MVEGRFRGFRFNGFTTLLPGAETVCVTAELEIGADAVLVKTELEIGAEVVVVTAVDGNVPGGLFGSYTGPACPGPRFPVVPGGFKVNEGPPPVNALNPGDDGVAETVGFTSPVKS